jgi:phage-related protein
MVIETRGGAQIGALNENVQGIQQQLDEHSNQIGLINVKLDRMESNFGEFKATFSGFQGTLSGFQSAFSGLQAMMEEGCPNQQNRMLTKLQVQFGFNLVLVSNCQLLLQALIGFQLGLRRGMACQ